MSKRGSFRDRFFLVRAAGKPVGGAARRAVSALRCASMAASHVASWGLTGVVELQVLLEDKQMLGPIVAGERRDDVRLGCVAAGIAMLGQLHGVTAAGRDVAEDPQPGEAG